MGRGQRCSYGTQPHAEEIGGFRVCIRGSDALTDELWTIGRFARWNGLHPSFGHGYLEGVERR